MRIGDQYDFHRFCIERGVHVFHGSLVSWITCTPLSILFPLKFNGNHHRYSSTWVQKGVWIGQKDSRGLVVPITCVSKKMGPTQQRWSATKRELYALMWGMQKLRHYLLGRQFIARVDHKPLIDLLKNKMTPLLEGWMDTVLQFDFTTVYLPGEENEFADALSRAHEVTAQQDCSDGMDSELLFEAAKRGKSVPKPEERAAMIQRRHLLGHFSVEAVTKELWRDGFWWPRMRQDIATHISLETGSAKCVFFLNKFINTSTNLENI